MTAKQDESGVNCREKELQVADEIAAVIIKNTKTRLSYKQWEIQVMALCGYVPSCGSFKKRDKASVFEC